MTDYSTYAYKKFCLNYRAPMINTKKNQYALVNMYVNNNNNIKNMPSLS